MHVGREPAPLDRLCRGQDECTEWRAADAFAQLRVLIVSNTCSFSTEVVCRCQAAYLHVELAALQHGGPLLLPVHRVAAWAAAATRHGGSAAKAAVAFQLRLLHQRRRYVVVQMMYKMLGGGAVKPQSSTTLLSTAVQRSHTVGVTYGATKDTKTSITMHFMLPVP